MQVGVPLAGSASFDVSPPPFSVDFTLGSPISLAITSREFMLQLLEWFRKGVSEIHVGVRSVSMVVRWRAVGFGPTVGWREALKQRITLLAHTRATLPSSIVTPSRLRVFVVTLYHIGIPVHPTIRLH